MATDKGVILESLTASGYIHTQVSLLQAIDEKKRRQTQAFSLHHVSCFEVSTYDA